MRTKRLVLVILTTFVLTHLYFLHRIRSRSHAATQFHYDELDFSKPLPSANSTLGFGGIFAVSHADSPRRNGLLWAAELSDIDVIIPRQKIWTDRHVDEFKAANGSIITRGSALAWMGHLNALKWFLSTDMETALILEDDSDWDIRIRTSQVPLLAEALRTILPTTLAPNPLPTTNSSSTAPQPPKQHQQDQNQHPDQHPDPDTDRNYWGPLAAWDLLYLGHCDDIISVSSPLAHAHALYPDPTVPPHQLLHPDTANFVRALGIPEGHRFVHRSRWPLCTFAYGVNRRSAQRILEQFSKEEEGHGTSAFDVRLLEACRDLGWRCWSVAPELFHHSEGVSEIGNVDYGGGGEKDGVDEEEEEVEDLRNEDSGLNGDDSGDPSSAIDNDENDEDEDDGPPGYNSHFLPHQFSSSQTLLRNEASRPPSQYGTWNVRCGARHPQLRIPFLSSSLSSSKTSRTRSRTTTSNDAKARAPDLQKAYEIDKELDTQKQSLRTYIHAIIRKGECPIDFSKEERGWAGCEAGNGNGNGSGGTTGCGAQS